MDLALLRTFLTVYRAGSFTRAAAILRLSQPAVTAQIRSLERQVGTELFHRLPRGVAPTTVADDLARQAAPHLDALEELRDRGVGDADPLHRTLRLGGPPELTVTRIVPALSGLVTQGMKLHVTFGDSDHLLIGIVGGRLDLVVTTSRPRVRGVVGVALAEEEYVLVGTRAWLARLSRHRMDETRGAALTECPLIDVGSDLPNVSAYVSQVFDSRPALDAAVVLPDLRGVLELITAGVGVGVVPRHMCAGALTEGRIHLLHDPESAPQRTLFAAVRTGGTAKPHVAAAQRMLLADARTW